MMHKWGQTAIFCVVVALLSACTKTGENIGGPVRFDAESTPTRVLQRINQAAAKCWMKTSAFKGYGMVPELDTSAGKPRILLLQRGKPLPQWVIEASGSPVQLVTYGPLTNSSLSARMNDDVIRWSGGDQSCTS